MRTGDHPSRFKRRCLGTSAYGVLGSIAAALLAFPESAPAQQPVAGGASAPAGTVATSGGPASGWTTTTPVRPAAGIAIDRGVSDAPVRGTTRPQRRASGGTPRSTDVTQLAQAPHQTWAPPSVQVEARQYEPRPHARSTPVAISSGNDTAALNAAQVARVGTRPVATSSFAITAQPPRDTSIASLTPTLPSAPPPVSVGIASGAPDTATLNAAEIARVSRTPVSIAAQPRSRLAAANRAAMTPVAPPPVTVDIPQGRIDTAALNAGEVARLTGAPVAIVSTPRIEGPMATLAAAPPAPLPPVWVGVSDRTAALNIAQMAQVSSAPVPDAAEPSTDAPTMVVASAAPVAPTPVANRDAERLPTAPAGPRGMTYWSTPPALPAPTPPPSQTIGELLAVNRVSDGPTPVHSEPLIGAVGTPPPPRPLSSPLRGPEATIPENRPAEPGDPVLPTMRPTRQHVAEYRTPLFDDLPELAPARFAATTPPPPREAVGQNQQIAAFIPAEVSPSPSSVTWTMPAGPPPRPPSGSTGSEITAVPENSPSQSMPAETMPAQSLAAESLPAENPPTESVFYASLPPESPQSQYLPYASLPSESPQPQTLPYASLPIESPPPQSLPYASPPEAMPSMAPPPRYTPPPPREMRDSRREPDLTPRFASLTPSTQSDGFLPTPSAAFLDYVTDPMPPIPSLPPPRLEAGSDLLAYARPETDEPDPRSTPLSPSVPKRLHSVLRTPSIPTLPFPQFTGEEPTKVAANAAPGKAAAALETEPPPPLMAPELTLPFEPGRTDLNDSQTIQLKALVSRLGDDHRSRIQIAAYADVAGASGSAARRLSLSRALAIRSRLLEEGVPSTRIDVRALGNQVARGTADRVDVAVVAP